LKTWFTADTHFGHTNIIKFCNRPFSTIHRMNEVLTKNWNSRIKEDDLVIFLGDFAYREKSNVKAYLRNLNGHISFIRGNHDNNNSLDTRVYSLVIEFPNSEDVFCVHKPEDFNSNYKINLVGHIHNKWKVRSVYQSILVNVGVDVCHYYPIDIQEILKKVRKEEVRKIKKKEIKDEKEN